MVIDDGGLKIVEWGGGLAAGYASWLLGKLGAQVTRIDELHGVSQHDALSLALASLADGKATAAKRELAALLPTADILLCDDRTALASAGFTIDGLQRDHPHLVIGVASVFGLSGPLANAPATSLDAQALSGLAWALGEPSREPLSLPPGIVEHESGAMLAAGALVALASRDQDGAGQVVDVALADVLASYIGGNCRFYIHHNMAWHRSGRRASSSGGAYPFAILPCADGEVCLCGRTRDEWQRLIRVMGNPAWASEPRYQSLRAMGRDYPEEVDALIRPWLAQHDMADLERLAIENNLILSPVRSMADVLETPRFNEDGFLKPQDVGGQPLVLPQLPFRVHPRREPDAPDLAGTLLAESGPPAPSPEGSGERPLAGLRVLDFGWVWSAPWVGTMLAELGAEVIKVEHGGRPDNLRLSGKVWRDGAVVEGPSSEMSPMFHQVNHGKLGVTLNAKEPRAVALIKELVARSDLVIENMSPGSLERSGLGFEAIRGINPRVVMLSMSAAGQFGSLAGMRAYAPTMSSFAGMEALVGYPGEAPIGALNVGLGDPNASAHALVPVLAALRRARATGQGSYIDLSQVEALSSTLRAYLIDTQLQERQPPPTGNRHPHMAPHGIYPAAGNDRWLTLAVANDDQWRKLATAAGWHDARFTTTSGRLTNVEALEAMVGRWTAEQDRDVLVERLRSIGIAASPVLPIEEVWREPHFAARAVKQPVDIPFYGMEEVFRGPWRFSRAAVAIDRPGPRLGEHNSAIFGDLLGLSADEIGELAAAGVIA